MTFSATKCDECGRVKGEANHWHQMGVVLQSKDHASSIELGKLRSFTAAQLPEGHEVHDLCGELCLGKHISRLLHLGGTV